MKRVGENRGGIVPPHTPRASAKKPALEALQQRYAVLDTSVRFARHGGATKITAIVVWYPFEASVLATKSSKSPIATAPAASYEAAVTELEQLTARLEGGQLPLDELLASYQRGAALLKFCRDKLQAVESQVKLLDGSEVKSWTPE
jgi:exodeoxyribonuclease VII small subunit